MAIDLLYIIISVASILLGITIGWISGIKYQELKRVKRVLRAKNPELWDLEHYITVDEDTEKINKKKGTKNVTR